jgi:hypothetical protein
MTRLIDAKRFIVFAGLFVSLALASGCDSAGTPPTPQKNEEQQKQEADARKAAYGSAGIPTGKGVPKTAK